ncbi:MAG: fructose-6-phosphate aldolase [Firmicutes bacterium]|nr:fructose-6-phosphate aldolase [Bacillota bacterium]
MGIYLDSAVISEIKEFIELPFVEGVTTNPTLIAKALGRDTITWAEFEAHIKQIGELVDGDIFVQTNHKDAKGMVEDGKKIHAVLGTKAVIKIPATSEGLKAISELADNDIRTAATAVFTGVQAYLAMLSGADFVIPYYSRVQKAANDGLDLVEDILDIIESQEMESQLLVASIKNNFDVLEIIRAGAHAITIPADIIKELLAHHQTEDAQAAFNKSLTVKG